MANNGMADEYVEKYGFGSEHKNLTPQEAEEQRNESNNN